MDIAVLQYCGIVVLRYYGIGIVSVKGSEFIFLRCICDPMPLQPKNCEKENFPANYEVLELIFHIFI